METQDFKSNNYAFIDSQNVNLAVRYQGWRLDWARFRIYLQEKYNISKAFLFIGYVPGNEDLYISLQKAGFICVFKPTLEFPNGGVKGNVDAELVLHAMGKIQEYDQAVIVSGDGDFYCLAVHLIQKKKLCKLLIPNENRFSALLKFRIIREYLAFLNPLKDRLRYEVV